MGLLDDVSSEELVASNSYLEDTEKGLQLIADLQAVSEGENGVVKELQYLDKLIEDDYMSLSSRSDLSNEAEVYQQVLKAKDDIEEMIKFPFLANKNIVGIGGGFSAGKSKFINSILNKSMLPTDTRPTTSIPTYVAQGQETTIFSYNIFGHKTEIDLEAVKAVTHAFYEQYNLSFTRILKNITLQSKHLSYQNIAFLDTPGYTKSNIHQEADNTDKAVAQEHLRAVDYLIWLIDIEKGTVPAQDIEFIKRMEIDQPIFFIFNKADKKIKSDIKDILEVAKQELDKSKIKVAGVSAYSALEEKEYCGEKINDFLLALDKKNKEVDLLNQFKDVFNSYLDYHQQKIKEEKNKLEELNELALFSEAQGKQSFINQIIADGKEKIRNNKQLKKEFETLLQKFEEQVKKILTEVDVKFFDKEFRGQKLLEAIKEDNIRAAKKLINSSGADFKVTDAKGRNCLLWSVIKGQTELVKRLSSEIGNIDDVDKQGRSALLLAAKEGHPQILKYLLELKADYNLRDDQGHNALLVIVTNYNQVIIDLLLTTGIDINHQDETGATALMKAAAKGNKKLVQQLVDAGANLDIQDQKGKTALMKAAAKEQLEILELLIEAGADLNLRDKHRHTVIDLARQGRYSQDVELILEKIAVDRDKKGEELLLAVQHGKLDKAKRLIELEVNLDVEGNSEETALFWAIWEGYVELAVEMIEQGANLDKQNDEGVTPLRWAIAKGETKVAKKLITAGADLDLKTNSGRTALIKAVFEGEQEIALKLIAAGANLDLQYGDNDFTALMVAISEGYSKIARKLIEAGANLDLRTTAGRSALTRALYNNDRRIAKKIITEGANLDYKYHDNKITALMIAINRGQTEVAVEMIRAGAELNVQSTDNQTTALMWAVSENQLQVVKELIKAGANLNLQDQQGQTALCWAMSNREIALELIHAGTDVSLEDNEGYSAINYALGAKDDYLVEEIKKYA